MSISSGVLKKLTIRTELIAFLKNVRKLTLVTLADKCLTITAAMCKGCIIDVKHALCTRSPQREVKYVSEVRKTIRQKTSSNTVTQILQLGTTNTAPKENSPGMLFSEIDYFH